MGNETIQYHTDNASKSVYDAFKTFDNVVFNMLFNEMRARSVCRRNTKSLYCMYSIQ